MLSKKHSDPLYWKNKLVALDCLPGEPAMEKDALWEKLYERLQKKQTYNKAVWYWIAAGLLPLIIVVVTSMPGTNDNTEQLVQRKQNINTVVSVLPPASKGSAVVIRSLPVTQKQQVAASVNNIKNQILKDTVKMNESIAAVGIPGEPEVISVIDNNILKVDTALTTATVTPVKTKLPLIHINELETLRFTTSANYTEILSGIKPKRNKTNNQNVATQESKIGFNIKLSSKN